MTLLKDGVSETLDLLRECLRGMPPEARGRARRAAVLLGSAFDRLRKEAPNDNAVALGAAFFIFQTAERLIELDADNSKEGRGLIQLL